MANFFKFLFKNFNLLSTRKKIRKLEIFLNFCTQKGEIHSKKVISSQRLIYYFLMIFFIFFCTLFLFLSAFVKQLTMPHCVAVKNYARIVSQCVIASIGGLRELKGKCGHYSSLDVFIVREMGLVRFFFYYLFVLRFVTFRYFFCPPNCIDNAVIYECMYVCMCK